MEPDFLQNTKRLMRQKAADREFDSYAVYVKTGADESTFCSDNVNEDTYFDIASLGKVLVTTPLALQTIGRGLLRLDSRLGWVTGSLAKKMPPNSMVPDSTIYFSR